MGTHGGEGLSCTYARSELQEGRGVMGEASGHLGPWEPCPPGNRSSPSHKTPCLAAQGHRQVIQCLGAALLFSVNEGLGLDGPWV